ncbi:MAG: antitoxin family protein [Candidatus Methanoperedens sp.]|nr:antitoxin family protein [Candidatus Methanoperedens sp.]MCZ7406321.1 antitoxin family protein [Candidatus Methanoperedens sp.]
MSEAIPAIYEDGMFKPLQKVDLPEHKHVHLILMPEEEAALLNSQKKELSKIIGIGRSGKTDVSRKHDKYLY